MRTVKLSGLFLVCACIVLISGCVAEQQYKDLKIQNDTQRERIAGLESQLHSMVGQLGAAQLPVELSTMLEDFANGKDMVTYDSSRGIVKFSSDLLFKRGSDVVAAGAAEAINLIS